MLHVFYGHVYGSYILQVLARDFFLNSDPSGVFVEFLQNPAIDPRPLKSFTIQKLAMLTWHHFVNQ